jgi:pimeloyl-ACP methyl ester carboxylesterase
MTHRSSTGVLSHHNREPGRATASDARADAAAVRGMARCTLYRRALLLHLLINATARPLYDASRIEVPTLVIRGDPDGDSTHEDAFGLFEALGAEDKQYIVIGAAMHFLSLEKRAPMLIRQVQAFLED